MLRNQIKIDEVIIDVLNPIDLVMTVGDCGFLDAVNILKVRINQ